MAIFPTFFLGNIGQENVFYDILEWKNAFLGYKNKTFKKSKNWDFPKGVSPMDFCARRPFFRLSLSNIGQENVFYDILVRKYVLLGYKNKKFKKSTNWYFLESFNPYFWFQNGQFSKFFFFRKYWPGKVLLRYSRTKERVSRL